MTGVFSLWEKIGMIFGVAIISVLLAILISSKFLLLMIVAFAIWFL